MKTRITLAVLAAFGAAVATTSVRADDTGIAGIHSWMKVGKKTCFDGHAHSGTGTGPSKKVAEMQAINAWAGFTAWEYGTDWANLTKAIKKSMKCSGSGHSYSCDLEATPCK